MKNKILILLIGVSISIGMSGFKLVYDPQEYIVLNHTDSDGSRYIAILKSDKDLIDCHLEGGDSEVPYNEELYSRIIGWQEDGADICNH